MTDDRPLKRNNSDKILPATPTLQENNSADVHPKEEHSGRPVSEAGYDDTGSEHTHADEHGDGKGSSDVLIVDWEGPDDPQNPQKCVSLP